MTEQNQKQKILNVEQNALVVELTETYGIKPEEIIFFGKDADPFLSYEATCRLSNRLLNLTDIDIEPVPSVHADSFSVKCSLVFGDGRTRRGVGVVNLNETIEGETMNDSQVYQLASARSIRNALKNADVDLIAEHRQATSDQPLEFKVKSNYVSLLGQAHILGEKKQLIVGDNKALWYQELWSRYRVGNSNRLDETQLADFVAYLNSYEPPVAQQAAA